MAVGWLVPSKVASAQGHGKSADRALLGAYLLGLWGLPHPIIEAVAYHKEPCLLAHSAVELVDIRQGTAGAVYRFQFNGVGNGLVFCSDFMSDEDARALFTTRARIL